MIYQLKQAIGSTWEDVQNLDWDGWYPLLEVRRAELLVDPASLAVHDLGQAAIASRQHHPRRLAASGRGSR